MVMILFVVSCQTAPLQEEMSIVQDTLYIEDSTQTDTVQTVYMNEEDIVENKMSDTVIYMDTMSVSVEIKRNIQIIKKQQKELDSLLNEAKK